VSTANSAGPSGNHGLQRHLRWALAELSPPAPWWVAFSGGADSLALLAALRTITRDLTAVHVDHGLHPDSRHWAQRCRAMAADLDVGFRLVRVEVRPAGEGLEAAARQARYAAFEALLAAGGSLLLAHHADDQAETQLLQLLRGGGIAAMAGMPRQRTLGAGWLVRPVLDQPQSVLREAAAATRLDWVADPGNDDLHQDRNFLHHRVMPVLAERWPDVAQRLSRSADDAGRNLGLLQDLADDYLAQAGRRLPLSWLRCRDAQDREWLVRRWLLGQGVPPPGRHRLAQGLADIVDAAHDARPVMAWSQAQLRRHADAMYLLPPDLPGAFQAVTLEDVSQRRLSDGSCLGFQCRAGGVRARALADGIRVAPRWGGERLLLHGRTRRAKKLLQQAGVAPWDKAHYPVVWWGDTVIALPGVAVADGWRSRVGWWPVWKPAWQCHASGD
jgi:tRNA(Ile)-lysidine synthase